MLRIAAILFLLLALLAGALSLDGGAGEADLVFVNRGECHTLDPQRMSWLQDFRIAEAIYEGLVSWNNDTFDIEPGVAREWSVSDDGLTYTFALRTDAKWSNGDPVTAGDFLYAWRRALMPDTTADYADLFFKIRGGEEFFEWRSRQVAEFSADQSLRGQERQARAEELLAEARAHFAATVGLSAPDDHTLIVTLQQPTPYMLDLFAFGVFSPVHPPSVEPHITVDAATGSLREQFGWTKPPRCVTNGPLKLTRWRYKRDMLMEANPYYWNREKVRSQRVLSLSVEDTSTAVLAFQTGTIDWLSDLSAEFRADMLAQARAYTERHADRLEELKVQGLDYCERMRVLASESPPQEGERNDVHAFSAFGTYFFNFNCQEQFNNGKPNPFHDARIRRAFALAIDKASIVRNVTRMNQNVARTFIPPGSIPGYESPAGLGYDPAAARALLAEVGYEDRNGDGLIEDARGEPFMVVELLYSTGEDHKNIAAAISGMWERELGVRTTLAGKESKVFGDELKKHNFVTARGNWYGDYGDPTTFLDLFRTTNGNNDRAYSNAYFDELMARIDAELDPQARMDLLEEAEAFVMEQELPFVPLFHQVTLYMFDPAEVSGLTTHPRLVQYLWEMEVQRP